MSEPHAKALTSGPVVSYPVIEKTILYETVAQLVEQLPFKQWVGNSSFPSLTK